MPRFRPLFEALVFFSKDLVYKQLKNCIKKLIRQSLWPIQPAMIEVEFYLFLGGCVLALAGSYVAFGAFTEGCRSIHAKIAAAEKENKKKKRRL